MMVFNIKTSRSCAFCKYWYDPANSAISPKAPNINLWNVDDKCKNMCLKTNIEKKATATCSRFELKLAIQK